MKKLRLFVCAVATLSVAFIVHSKVKKLSVYTVDGTKVYSELISNIDSVTIANLPENHSSGRYDMKELEKELGDALPIATCNAEDVLKFFKNSNEVKSVELNGRYEFYFEENGLNVFSESGDAFVMPYNSFSKMCFDVESSAVNHITADEINNLVVKYNESTKTLDIISDKPVLRVMVYNMQGVLMCDLSPKATDVSFNIGHLHSGIYVVGAVL